MEDARAGASMASRAGFVRLPRRSRTDPGARGRADHQVEGKHVHKRKLVSNFAPVLGLIALLGGCASPGGGGGSSRGSTNVITQAQISELESLDVYAIVQRLQPRWLQVRGMSSAQGQAQIAVIVDSVRQQGSIELLRSMRGLDVRELRYLNARDATTRYGTDMTAGAIEVFTRR
jgi:hypothetical protein